MAKKKPNNFFFDEKPIEEKEEVIEVVEVAAEPEEAAVIVEEEPVIEVEEPVIVEKTVNKYINIRKEPSLTAEKVGTLQVGAKVKVYSVDGEWSCISENGDKYVRSIRLD